MRGFYAKTQKIPGKSGQVVQILFLIKKTKQTNQQTKMGNNAFLRGKSPVATYSELVTSFRIWLLRTMHYFCYDRVTVTFRESIRR